jgi:hypothetical protein
MPVPVVSRVLYYRDPLDGLNGDFVDARPRRRTRAACLDVSPLLAKVRVAGPNPVVRSERQVSNAEPLGARRDERRLCAAIGRCHARCPRAQLRCPSRSDTDTSVVPLSL